MGRPGRLPIGARAMTNAERQHRKRAKARKRKQSAQQAVAVERMLAPKPVVVDGPMLKVEHLRMGIRSAARDGCARSWAGRQHSRSRAR